MRVRFSDLFLVHPNGMISPKVVVRIGSAQLGTGTTFGAGASFNGVNFHSLQGKDFEVEQEGGVCVIKSYC